MEEKGTTHRGHVLVLPVPIQGHINPMLQFSKRLFSKGIKVTLLIYSDKYNQQQQQQLPAGSNSIKVEKISFPEYDMSKSVSTYLNHFRVAVAQTLPELAVGQGISCIVYDSGIPWALDIAKGLGVTGASFFTQSCAVGAIFYSVHEGQLSVPFEGQSVSLPGFPLLERYDLPSFVYDTENQHPGFLSLHTSQFSNFRKADWIFFNSFNSLEKEVLNWLETQRAIKSIGPTIPSMYLDKSLEDDKGYGLNLYKPNTEICMNWLDSKEEDSVVYVSFGSLAALGKEQMEELAQGLKKSNNYFLWVVRDSEENKLPSSFQEEISEKGLVVNWSPQLEVLAHKSVGCFMTHCGWNSTLEAISLGVPMVAMPQWTDQTTNAKFVEDVWKVGVRVQVNKEGIVRREEIDLCIREIMEGERGKYIKRNSQRWKDLAREAFSEGGSSDKNIEEFISEILYNR